DVCSSDLMFTGVKSDPTPPIVRVVQKSRSGNTVTVTFTASDPESGVNAVVVQNGDLYNGTPWTYAYSPLGHEDVGQLVITATIPQGVTGIQLAAKNTQDGWTAVPLD